MSVLAAEQVVIRSFPVSSLFKTKSFKVHDYPHISDIDKNLQVREILCFLFVLLLQLVLLL